MAKFIAAGKTYLSIGAALVSVVGAFVLVMLNTGTMSRLPPLTGQVSPSQITLQSVSVYGGNVTVTYGKNFSDCAHLQEDGNTVLHSYNWFCDQGTTVTVTKSTSDIRVSVGQRVQLCHGNDSSLCTPFVTVIGSLPQITLQSINVYGGNVTVTYGKNIAGCASLKHGTTATTQNYFCAQEETVTVTRSTSEIPVTIGQRVQLCNNTESVCSPFVTVTDDLPITLRSVNVSGSTVTVIYGKNFPVCVYLKDEQKGTSYTQKLFSDQGQTVTVTASTSNVPVDVGQRVQLCHCHEHALCSLPVTVTGDAPRITLQSVSVSGYKAAVTYGKNIADCARLEDENRTPINGGYCDKGEAVTVTRSANEIRVTAGQRVRLCYNNSLELCTPFVTVTGDAPRIMLQSVSVSRGNVTVAYGKSFSGCAHMKDGHGTTATTQNYFCAQGETLTVTQSTSEIPVTIGQRVQLCNGTESLCTPFVTVTDATPQITLQSVSVSGGNVTVTYGKNLSTCAFLQQSDYNKLHWQDFFCAQGETVTVTRSTSEIPVTIGQNVCLCYGNSRELCTPFVTVTGAPKITLHSVSVIKGNVTVTYGKNLSDFAHLKDENGTLVTAQNYFRIQGETVTAIQPTGNIRVSVGQRVRLCYNTSSGLCSAFVTVTDGTPNITLQSVSVGGGNVTVTYGKNFSDCVYLRDWDAHMATQKFFCDQGATVTVTRSTSEIPATIGQRVMLCKTNDLSPCSPFVVVTDDGTPQNPDDGDDSDADDTDPTDDTDQDAPDLYDAYLSAKEERDEAASNLKDVKAQAKQERTAAIAQAKTTYLAVLEEAKDQYTADRTAAKETYSTAKKDAQEQYASAKEDAEQEYKDAVQALADAKAAYRACRDEGGSVEDCATEREAVTEAKEAKADTLATLKSVRAEAKVEYTAVVASTKEAYTAALAEARTAYADRKQEAKDAALEARTAAQAAYDEAVQEAADAYQEAKDAYDEAKAAYEESRG
ncbi:MAG: hypothetical protein V1926_01135 [Candidatus Peregrinibacteria bacterium]